MVKNLDGRERQRTERGTKTKTRAQHKRWSQRKLKRRWNSKSSYIYKHLDKEELQYRHFILSTAIIFAEPERDRPRVSSPNREAARSPYLVDHWASIYSTHRMVPYPCPSHNMTTPPKRERERECEWTYRCWWMLRTRLLPYPNQPTNLSHTIVPIRANSPQSSPVQCLPILHNIKVCKPHTMIPQSPSPESSLPSKMFAYQVNHTTQESKIAGHP